jgi:phosphoglycolate phosphatase
VVRLVVFDLDGTLIDATRDLATAVNRALAEASPGLPPLPESTVRSFIGEGARNLVRRCLAHLGLSLPAEAVLPVFLERYGECLLDSTTLYPDVPAALDALAHLRLAVLTNKPGDLSRRILAGLGIGDCFFRVLGGGDVPSRKPDPEGLRVLMAEAGTAAGETALVGDSAVDMATGHAAGVLKVGLTRGFDPDGVRAGRPDLLLESLAELPAALARG